MAAIARCPFRARPWQPKSTFAVREQIFLFSGPDRVGRASPASANPPASAAPPVLPDPAGPGTGQDQQADIAPFTFSQAASTAAPTVVLEEEPPLASEATSFLNTISSLGGWSWQGPTVFPDLLDEPVAPLDADPAHQAASHEEQEEAVGQATGR